MTRGTTRIAMFVVAALLMVMSLWIVVSYIGPEPFEVYRRRDAAIFLGGSIALITLWGVWSISIIAAVYFKAFKPWALLGLLVAACATFYLLPCFGGYLDDLEVMLQVR